MAVFNRAKIIDENFTKNLLDSHLPTSTINLTPESVGLNQKQCIDLFESQLISRHLDLQSRILKEKDLSYYTIGSSGHEGNAVIGKVFRYTDMAFLHYRSGAFMIQRSKQLPKSTPIKDHLLALVASSEDPISGGRHKVFGSKPLFVPPQTSTIASHLPKAVGIAFSITRAKDIKHHTSELPLDSVIICSFGDATTNHSTAQGAFNAAQWITYRKIPLPLVFICEDNGIGISVDTPNEWIKAVYSNKKELNYIQADGLNFLETYRAAKEAEIYAREIRKPVFLHLKMVRLMGHAGSDVEMMYRTLPQIEETEFNDPLLHSSRIMLENDMMDKEDILALYESVRNRVALEAIKIASRPKLQSAIEIMSSIIPSPERIDPPPFSIENHRLQVFGRDYENLKKKGTLASLLNLGLIDILLRYPNTLVFGEDVGAKGGVYNVTSGLREKFGIRRVFDSLLDEQTILGIAIGLAHNGFIPIPEIQFLAYLHNAEDQIRGEAATLPFFSKGQYVNPMVIRIASLAYQKGFGGHFHNDNSVAFLRDIPGIIIACPSNGEDAVKMLRTCISLANEQKRIVAFLEPIALYSVKDLHEPKDEQWMYNYPKLNETIPLGEFGTFGEGDDLTIISYANGYYLSRQVEKILREKYQINAKLIDLRWIAPIDKAALVKELKNSKHILIVDECRQTGSLSEEIITMLVENLTPLPPTARITGHDSFIPLGEAWKYVLPDIDRILEIALKLMAK